MGKKNNFKLIQEIDITSHIKQGRHLCNCQARIHKLVRNCLSCGRIVCEQEGSGPCFFCGQFVCTKEERNIIGKNNEESLQLLRKILNKPDLQSNDANLALNLGKSKKHSLALIARSIENANTYKLKLLEADRDSGVTKVNDLQADYFSLEHNPYLTNAERNAIIKRKEELRILNLQSRKNFLVEVDVTKGKMKEQKKMETIESVNDPILQSIIINSMGRNLAGIALESSESGVDNVTTTSDLVKEFRPKYDECSSLAESKPELIMKSLQQKGEGILPSLSNKFYCIALRQPFATLLIESKISHISWRQYINYRGQILIASLDADFPIEGFYDAMYQHNEIAADEDEMRTKVILGKSILRECVTWEEYNHEYSSSPNFCSVDNHFVLIFDDQESLLSPIPYASPSEFHKLDWQTTQAICSTLQLPGGGAFDSVDPSSVVLLK